ncbi:hypothetical protein Q7O_001179 [Pectobacterium carotovorum subsp. carotovorum PCCS1]|nr:hypothetical protein [Pectobacterium carotovorum subsp. carotovorum PCCS1]
MGDFDGATSNFYTSFRGRLAGFGAEVSKAVPHVTYAIFGWADSPALRFVRGLQGEYDRDRQGEEAITQGTR